MGSLGSNQDGMMGMDSMNNDFMYGVKKGKVEDNYGDTEDEDCA